LPTSDSTAFLMRLSASFFMSSIISIVLLQSRCLPYCQPRCSAEHHFCSYGTRVPASHVRDRDKWLSRPAHPASYPALHHRSDDHIWWPSDLSSDLPCTPHRPWWP